MFQRSRIARYFNDIEIADNTLWYKKLVHCAINRPFLNSIKVISLPDYVVYIRWRFT